VLETVEGELDARLQEMEDEDYEAIRARRIEAMRKDAEDLKKFQAAGHGSYDEVFDEKEFFNVCKKSERVVAHFYRPSNEPCLLVDKHLTDLSRKHMESKFIKINAEKAQFLAERLKIWMLPTIVLIIDGKTQHSIIGFEELGNTTSFSTQTLEQRLIDWQVLWEGGKRRDPRD
jgi:thiol-disulfide isomerase/thioredoxin